MLKFTSKSFKTLSVHSIERLSRLRESSQQRENEALRLLPFVEKDFQSFATWWKDCIVTANPSSKRQDVRSDNDGVVAFGGEIKSHKWMPDDSEALINDSLQKGWQHQLHPEAPFGIKSFLILATSCHSHRDSSVNNDGVVANSNTSPSASPRESIFIHKYFNRRGLRGFS